ncbi:TIM barrel protein [Mucilaginibacter koreensis]
MSKQSRRTVIKSVLAGTAAVSLAGKANALGIAKEESNYAFKGEMNQSVSHWCFNELTLDQLCVAAKGMGIRGIDLCSVKEWPILKKHGMASPMCNGAEISLTDGFNEKRFHPTLIKNYTEMIPLVAKAGHKNLICFSGSRRGMDDETGLKNCEEGLKQLLPIAEKHGVVLVMELLNSKKDHKDYQCDRPYWGAELAKRMGSENFKLLFDIYHMQVQVGDIIQNINDFHPYIAHYHTAGVPGRHEIDDTQELYYPAVMKAIKATGFKGFVGQEFVPQQKDKLASLKQAVQICDV